MKWQCQPGAAKHRAKQQQTEIKAYRKGRPYKTVGGFMGGTNMYLVESLL